MECTEGDRAPFRVSEQRDVKDSIIGWSHLFPSCWLDCVLFTLLPARPFCSSSTVSPSPCASPSLSLPPHIIYCFVIATFSSSSMCFPCSSSFFIKVCPLPSFPPWHLGANRDCIDTGGRIWLPNLCSPKMRSREQVVLENVFLGLLHAAGANLPVPWHTGIRWVCSQDGSWEAGARSVN